MLLQVCHVGDENYHFYHYCHYSYCHYYYSSSCCCCCRCCCCYYYHDLLLPRGNPEFTLSSCKACQWAERGCDRQLNAGDVPGHALGDPGRVDAVLGH